ncbi:hypothetical protein QJS04_geneDACA014229 [Acorus gramineus]|uniref:RNase H type-1 domain-containing protein n=1 Tax=Acorus gramineus TaxID=55184 RepID=A0AAV9BXF3_ACOGR|nr:hypothetical protein QJS04_geneDACA014229 [Acorus gramineus]
MPLFTGALTHSLCQPLIEEIRARVQSWTGKTPSIAGRMELIRSVLCSFHIYWSTTFILPQKTIKETEKLIRTFLWQGCSPTKKLHHLNWLTVCKPFDEGGLGIRRLKDWNTGAQGVRFWDLASNNTSLWSTWVKRRYIKTSNIWSHTPPMSSTNAWKRIMHTKTWITGFVRYVIFEGKSINVWYDPWLNGKGLRAALGRDLLPLSTNLSVLIQNGKWTKRTTVIWEPPEEGWLKLNTDGSLANDRGGYGAIIRNPQAEFTIGLAGRLDLPSINLLELKAIEQGVWLGIFIEASKLWIESDSTTALALIRGSGHIPWSAFRSLRRLHQGLELLDCWKASHIHREGNSPADLLAAHQSPRGEIIIQTSHVWEELQAAIALTACFISYPSLVCKEWVSYFS